MEAAAFDSRRYHPNYVLEPFNTPHKKPPHHFPPMNKELVIWKLHGSLPIPHSDGKLDQAEFENWLDRRGYQQLIATSASYRSASAALAMQFPHFSDLLADLTHSDKLCLFLGTSLTSAELIIFSLLYSRWRDPKNLFILNISAPAEERQIRFAELGIQTLNLPKGLAGNPSRRHLAYIVLLQILLDKIALPEERRDQAKKYLSDAYEELLVNSLTHIPVANTVPIVGCVGPVQITRVIGLADAAQQEAFHAPAKATRTPKSNEAEILISDASMGQVGNALLVWDAMELPVAVIAEIGDDLAGASILDRLQNMKWTDFDGILQVLPQSKSVPPTEASPGCATESYMCVTWLGVRTGFDSFRFERRSRCTPDQWQQEFSKIRNVAILYLTKVLSDEIMSYFRDLDQISSLPLIVFETGGGGAADVENWVASMRGVLIASAKTALRWIDKHTEIPGNEFGRYVQLARLLDHLQEVNEVVIKAPLAPARAIVVTLGELGALWWYPLDYQSGPFWTFPISLEHHANEKVCLKEAQVCPSLKFGTLWVAGLCASRFCSLTRQIFEVRSTKWRFKSKRPAPRCIFALLVWDPEDSILRNGSICGISSG